MSKLLWCVAGLAIFLLVSCVKNEEAALINETGAPVAESNAAPSQENQPSPNQEAAMASDELLRNPFLSEEEEKEFQDAGKAVPVDYLMLSAILYSATAKSKAIINGRILEIGDSIDNKEIITIRPEAVILKDTTTEYIVRLRNL